MLDGQIPHTVEPRKLARQDVRFDGEVAVTVLKRLQQSLVDSDGAIRVQLHFFRDLEGRTCIEGTLGGELAMECQRCLEPAKVNVESEISLAVVWNDDQAKALPSHLEPLVVTEDSTSLWDLIEDEVILALPLIPGHDDDACRAGLIYTTDPEGNLYPEEEVSDKKQNPFSVLAGLKPGGND
ncbi:YceD family protein [Spongorhabdus nitratireducens]